MHEQIDFARIDFGWMETYVLGKYGNFEKKSFEIISNQIQDKKYFTKELKCRTEINNVCVQW